jgi:hypothetical protein
MAAQVEALEWHTLDPLGQSASAALAEQPLLTRLFFALGGDLPWFRRRAWPCVLRWEAQLAGLPGPGPGARHSAFAASLRAACAAAEAWQCSTALSIGSEARLEQASRAAFDMAWRQIQGLRVRDAAGQGWDAAQGSLRDWRRARPQPQQVAFLTDAHADDPWGCAARRLVVSGVWALCQPTGRWLALDSSWGVLWPLAGCDLQRSHRDCGGSPVPLAEVIAGLFWWGYLDSSPGAPRVRVWQRGDGRVVQVLPVAETLRRRAGLERSEARGPRA